MRKKIKKYNLGGMPGGIPPNIMQLLQFAQGQSGSSGSGLGGINALNSAQAPSPLGAPGMMNSLMPGTVSSGTYGTLDKGLQGLSNAPANMLQNVASFNQGQSGASGSGMGGVQAVNMLNNELDLETNEFDQLNQTVTKAKKAGNIIGQGRQAIQTARGIKEAGNLAANAGGDVANLLGGLGQVGTKGGGKMAAKLAAMNSGKAAGFMASGAGAAAGAGLGVIGKLIQEKDKKDGNYSTLGAMGGGAMQGASIGMMFGPVGAIAGGAIGAGIGALQKKKFEEQARAEELRKKKEEDLDRSNRQAAGRALLKTFPVQGIQEQIYALGGETGDVEPPIGPPVEPPVAIAGAMPTALELAAANQMNRMTDPRTREIMTEHHPLAAEFIDNDLMNINKRTWLKSQNEKNPTDRPAWSSATVSNLMTQAYPGFKESMAHAGYMQDIIYGKNKANFKAKRTSGLKDYPDGTVITVGRGPNKGKNFGQLKRTVKDYDPNVAMPTHGAVITGSYTDKDGNVMYQVQGGNEGFRLPDGSVGPEGTETLGLKNMSAQDIQKHFPMALLPPKKAHGGFTNPTAAPPTINIDPRMLNLNETLSEKVSNMAPSNDRLISYTNQEMQNNENRALAKQSQESVNQNISNFANFHKEKPLDAIGMDLAVMGQVPILGEVADLTNAGLSYGRAGYNYLAGDTAKAKEQTALGTLSAASAIPFLGNATGAARLAHGAHKLAHGAHNIEKGVIGAKAAKAANYESKYRMGGYTSNPEYLAEGGEIIQHAPGDLPATDNNGTVTPITDTIAKINGDKHIAQSGGVGMEGEEPARIYSDQLKVPADLVKQLSKL